MSTTEMCHCGKPLHYNSQEVRGMVEAVIRQCGANQKVTVGKRTWLVPRHYIALHGIKGALMETYGFKEITGCR